MVLWCKPSIYHWVRAKRWLGQQYADSDDEADDDPFMDELDGFDYELPNPKNVQTFHDNLIILTNFYEGWLDEEEVADLLDDLNKLL